MTEMLLLGIDQGDRAAVDRILTAMHREIARLGRLASDLLLLSQLEDGSGGRLPLTTAPIDVAALIDEVIEAMAPLTSGRAVRSEVDAGLVVVGDPDRLKQVLVNLVENAARHTFPGGTIVIAGHHVSDGGVALSVADDGDGLAPGDADRIFDRFYRSDSARARSAAGAGSDTGTEAGPLATNGSDDTATSEGGAGLGLAIVRAIAEAHGGWAAAASPGPGLGTTVTVTLPATPGRAGARRGPDAPSSATRQGSPDQTAD
jgi:signal transduction histidine kinase